MNASFSSRLDAFSKTLHPLAAQLDTDDTLLRATFARFCQEELHQLGSVRCPLSGREFAETLATLAANSGAFAFIVLQQIVANMSLLETDDAVWPVVGVAFGHLRAPDGPAPIWDGETVSGPIPWMTGARLFPEVILGVRSQTGEEIFARVDARDRPEFRHSPPMCLIAGTGTDTVAVEAHRLPLDTSQILYRQSGGSMAQGDANSVLYQTPLMIGNLRASLDLIATAPRLSDAERNRSKRQIEAEIEKALNAFDGCDSATGRRIRAHLGDLTVRMARLAVMACGGSALQSGHPAERLYREALLYSLMAQTPQIVSDALTEVLQ